MLHLLLLLSIRKTKSLSVKSKKLNIAEGTSSNNNSNRLHRSHQPLDRLLLGVFDSLEWKVFLRHNNNSHRLREFLLLIGTRLPTDAYKILTASTIADNRLVELLKPRVIQPWPLHNSTNSASV